MPVNPGEIEAYLKDEKYIPGLREKELELSLLEHDLDVLEKLIKSHPEPKRFGIETPAEIEKNKLTVKINTLRSEIELLRRPEAA